MSVIAVTDYSGALEYKGFNLTTKYNGKKHKVYLKVICDDFSLSECIELAKSSKNILMLEYQGMETFPMYTQLKKDVGVYIGRVTDMGNNISDEDLLALINDTPEGVVPIVRLPDDFKNLRVVSNLSEKFPTVRFCGGNLFSVKGVKVGAVGVDLLKSKDIKFDQSAYMLSCTDDVLEDIDINELEIETSSKPESTTKQKKQGSGTKKQNKVSKPSISFSSMLLKGGIQMP